MTQLSKRNALAILLPLALLGAVWLLSSPYRVRRQFETQAQNQLDAASPRLFRSKIQVVAVRPNLSGYYEVHYVLRWQNDSSAGFSFSSGSTEFCDLDAVGSRYQGQCSFPPGATGNKQEFFHVSVRPWW